MSQATRGLYGQLKLGLPFDEFNGLVEEFFRKRFTEVGAHGPVILVDGWHDSDHHNPFMALCLSLAEQIATKYEFKPFQVAVHGSGVVDQAVQEVTGLFVHYNECAIHITQLVDSSDVAIRYYWPNEAAGVACVSRACRYNFDLADPAGLDQFLIYFWQHCDLMLTQSPAPIIC